VVIADLRRSLGDDAREPRHIVTIPKRGYRLTMVPAVAAKRPIRLATLAAGLAALLGLAIFALTHRTDLHRTEPSGGAETIVLVLPVVNETGQSRYAPLSAALTELVVNKVTRQEKVVVYSDPDATVPAGLHMLTLKSRLILWNGQPTLSFTASESRDHKILWAGMAAGPEDAIATHAVATLDALARRIASLPPPASGLQIIR
jgi:hypothetical protein